MPLFYSVSQGSVLGQLLFTLFTTPLRCLINSQNLDADDIQVYTSLSKADTDLSLKQLCDCLSNISGWMTNNNLRFNANKHISSLYVHPDNAANLLISPLRTSLVFASHNQTMCVILVLHLTAILISETYFSDMSLLLLPYSWPSTYSVLYFSFSCQNYCYSTHY